jgi:hypothetical protein
MVTESVKSWLLEPSNPSVKYRTLTELLDMPADDPRVLAARKYLSTSPDVMTLLNKMNPDGYWLQKKQNTSKEVGAGVEYGSFGTTHFCLSYLAELGLDKYHPKVRLAAERYLSLQSPDGDWYNHLSCLYGYNIRTFLQLGYRSDRRVQNSIQLLLGSVRNDGGYLCDAHDPERKEKAKSCIRGSLKALAAFAELGSEYWRHPSCKKLVEYFLSREGIYQKKDPSKFVNRDVQTMIYPFHWRAGLLEMLYYLSMMGYGNDPRLERAWKLLATKTDKEGRFLLEWTPTQSPWKVGKRGSPNKWMTLYASLALKAANRKNPLKHNKSLEQSAEKTSIS